MHIHEREYIITRISSTSLRMDGSLLGSNHDCTVMCFHSNTTVSTACWESLGNSLIVRDNTTEPTDGSLLGQQGMILVNEGGMK